MREWRPKPAAISSNAVAPKAVTNSQSATSRVIPDNSAKDNIFPRQYRLRGRSTILGLLSRGVRRRGRWCEIVAAANPTDSAEPTRFGISVTRKAGNSVRRNRIKRLAREFWRTHKWLWPENKAILIRIKTPVADETGFLAELEDMLKNL